MICAAVQAYSKQSGGLFLAPDGMAESTFYVWKAKYGGMEVSDVKRLKELEDEHARLKRLLAESLLDQAALQDLLSRKW